MYEITIIGEFSAAHALRGYKGKCEKLHGHNWKVEVTLSGENLDKVGLLYDFNKAKEKLNRVLSKLDHTNLNTIRYFRNKNPSSEEIAKFIYRLYKRSLGNTKSLQMKSVRIWESDSACVGYYER